MYNTLISIEPDTGVDSVTYGRIYHQCEGVNFTSIPNSGLKSTWQKEETRCGGESSWLVTYRGHMSGNVYTRHYCQHHAEPWLAEWEKMNGSKGES